MSDLPLELLQLIAQNVDEQATLLALRGVSNALNLVVTPLAFRVLVIRDSVEGGEALSSLQDCADSITCSVREIIFAGDSKIPSLYGWIRDGETSGKAGREALARAFGDLSKFPNLTHLELRFHDVWQEACVNEAPENPTHFLQLQLRLFQLLAENPLPGLVSLTLHNVVAAPHEIYDQENFLAFFRRLEFLEISILYDLDFCGYYIKDPVISFWNNMANVIRNATAVTTLVIRSDHPVGSEPVLPFGHIHLPHLQSLTLQLFCILPADPDADVLSFILEHAATLKRLELRDCSIDGGEERCHGFPRPWHAVLASLKTGLPNLNTFVLENRKPVPEDEQDSRFAYTYRENSWVTYTDLKVGDEPVVGNKEDLVALETLLAVVDARQKTLD
ncbi:hypothetical protein C8F01DRAFT_1161824 [Mycena amicta]|nr:hypothetical protein C8F01DRAFT_1161824 [Mycena amicta]